MLSLSFFQRDTQPQVTQFVTESFRDFVVRFRKPKPSSTPKRELALWSPATFREAYRKKNNVESVCLLTLDVDVDPVPSRNDLHEALDGLQAVAHSSSSATRLYPRWRVGIALSRPVSADEYARLWSVFTGSLPFAVGQEAKDPSRAWYEAREGQDGYYEVFDTRGRTIDVDYLLDLAPPPSPDKPPAPSTAPASPAPALYSIAAGMLGQAWPPTGHRVEARLALFGALCNSGLTQDQALEFADEVHSHLKDRRDVDRKNLAQTISETYRKQAAGEPIGTWNSLGKHVSPAIVKATQDLLRGPEVAAAEAEFKARLEAPPATGSVPSTEQALAPTPTTKEKILKFEYGAWEHEPPPVDFIVEGLIPRGCVAMWYGRADSLKTWLLYSLSIAIARGEPWLGKYKTKPVKVGIVDYETGKGNVRRRLYMLRAGCLQNLGTVAYASLKPNQAEFWGELAKEGFDIVFIDSLRRANPGGDENDSDEAVIPLNMASEFSEHTGCSVHYIHHAKKSSADGWPEFRGSAAIEDQVDCSFVVRKLETGAAKKTVDVKCEKPGDMRTPDPFSVEVEFNDSARTATVRLGTPVAAEEEPTDARIRQAIKLALAGGPLIKTEIKKRVTGNNARVLQEISALVELGEILKTDAGYILDGPNDRRARVLEQVREYDSWTTPAKLAKAAQVSTELVEKMLREGVICRRGSGDTPGFIVVDRE